MRGSPEAEPPPASGTPPAPRRLAARAGGMALAAGVVAGGCFGLGGGAAAPPHPFLRPAVQRLGPHQVVGNAVVASFAGVAISLEPLTPDQLDAFYENRPGLVNPLKGLTRGAPPPLAFRMFIRNRGRQAVQLEPATFLLTDQEDRRLRPLEYGDFYQIVAELPDAELRLRSVQATTFSTFLTVNPGAEREGFVFFPPPLEGSRLLVLELGTLYLGARDVPLVAEFEVMRPKGAPARRP